LNHDDSVAPGVDRLGAGSPERLIERLNRQLKKIGVVVQHTAKLAPNAGPPCFRVAGASYYEWMAQASMAYETLPYRLSRPEEPNYCHDCTPAFKAEMLAVKACLFPNVTFETAKEFGESVTVGMSRSPDVAPEVYPVYDLIIDKRRP
jgi:hypothetical protein